MAAPFTKRIFVPDGDPEGDAPNRQDGAWIRLITPVPGRWRYVRNQCQAGTQGARHQSALPAKPKCPENAGKAFGQMSIAKTLVHLTRIGAMNHD